MIVKRFYGADRKLQPHMYKMKKVQFAEFSPEEQFIKLG